MTRPYMFVIRSSPTVMSQNYGKIGGAFVHVWVMDGEQEAALMRAIAYIRKYLWGPQEVEHAFQILPEQIAQLGGDELRLYHTALSHGIAADFLGRLKDEGELGGPALLWRL